MEATLDEFNGCWVESGQVPLEKRDIDAVSLGHIVHGLSNVPCQEDTVIVIMKDGFVSFRFNQNVPIDSPYVTMDRLQEMFKPFENALTHLDYTAMGCPIRSDRDGKSMVILGKRDIRIFPFYSVSYDGTSADMKIVGTNQEQAENKISNAGLCSKVVDRWRCTTDRYVLVTESFTDYVYGKVYDSNSLVYAAEQVIVLYEKLYGVGLSHNLQEQKIDPASGVVYRDTGGYEEYLLFNFNTVKPSHVATFNPTGPSSLAKDIGYFLQNVVGLASSPTNHISRLVKHNGHPRYLFDSEIRDLVAICLKYDGGKEYIVHGGTYVKAFEDRNIKTEAKSFVYLDNFIIRKGAIAPQPLKIDMKYFYESNYSNRAAEFGIPLNLIEDTNVVINVYSNYFLVPFPHSKQQLINEASKNGFVFDLREVKFFPDPIGDDFDYAMLGYAPLFPNTPESVIKKISTLRKLWSGGYSYPSKLYVNYGNTPQIIDFVSFRPLEQEEQKIQDIETLIVGIPRSEVGQVAGHLEAVGLGELVRRSAALNVR